MRKNVKKSGLENLIDFFWIFSDLSQLKYIQEIFKQLLFPEIVTMERCLSNIKKKITLSIQTINVRFAEKVVDFASKIDWKHAKWIDGYSAQISAVGLCQRWVFPIWFVTCLADLSSAFEESQEFTKDLIDPFVFADEVNGDPEI